MSADMTLLNWFQRLLSIAILAFLLFKLQKWFQAKNKIPLPPRPAGLPFLGNMLDILSATKIGQQHLLCTDFHLGLVVHLGIRSLASAYLRFVAR